MPLRFETTNTGPFPYTGNDVGIALTVALVSGDPMVLYLNQTSFEDPIHYVALALDHTYKTPDSPAGWDVISGFAFDPIRDLVFASSLTTNRTEVMAFDPATDLAVADIDLAADQDLIGDPTSIGTNGLFYIRAGGPRVELRALNGAKLGQREYPGRTITGASAAGFGWIYADRAAHEIIVADPFGNIVQTCPAPGPAGGLGAIAFDYVVNHNRMPKVIPPTDGSAPGDPDERWSPEPWIMRHRIYVANDMDQTIHAGYLTED